MLRSTDPVTSAPAAVRAAWRLPRPVWLLGWASFATDFASEAIYPLLPLFLTRRLGAGPLALGLIEGVAEATASVLKVLSGWLADWWRRPKWLVLAGYGLSSTVRPLMALAGTWWHVLALRFLDRVGKGLRTAPRDAMLAAWAAPGARGWVYGFHRAMDHGGAVAGPLAATLFLWVVPEGYRLLFAATLGPGLVAMWLLSRVPESTGTDRATIRAQPVGGSDEPPSVLADRARSDEVALRAPAPGDELPGRFWMYLGVLALFTLGNASDAFLLLRLSDLGVAPPLVPLLWSVHHVVKVGASLFGGGASDRWDRRRVIATGWVVYALVYVTFGLVEALGPLVAAFLLYGVYFGLTEGPERAFVADLAPPSVRGTAFGLYGAVLGIGALAASVFFGGLWQLAGPRVAFFVGAGCAASAAFLMVAAVRR